MGLNFQPKEFESMISQQLEMIREKIETTRESVEDITSEPFGKHPHSALQAEVLDYLASAPGKVTPQEVAQSVGKNPISTRRATGKLVQRGLIQRLEDGSLILSKP